MSIHLIKSGTVCATLLLTLSACQTTTREDPEFAASRAEFRNELPPELYDFAVAAALAESIAGECRSIKFNKAAANERMQALDGALQAKGYQESDLRVLADKLPHKRAQDDFISFIQKNEIVITEPSTFCVAGQREIANGTQIGALLKG